MKIVTASKGKQALKLSKKDWEAMGKIAGWNREAVAIPGVQNETKGALAINPAVKVALENIENSQKLMTLRTQIDTFLNEISAKSPEVGNKIRWASILGLNKFVYVANQITSGKKTGPATAPAAPVAPAAPAGSAPNTPPAKPG